jgi:1-acyl-sn-glycerol-3-phosphate acyltransferase
MVDGGDADRAELKSLTPFERRAFRLARHMNQGRWKRFWCFCDREIGARWINTVVGRRVRIYGLEHIEAAARDRPLVLAANHRSFFDMYVVMAQLFRRTSGWREIYFPVRGRFFYQTAFGVFLNMFAAWWAMYPPFFLTPAKRRFDQYAMGLLAAICREGAGRLVGFHPEGTRNKNPDPYSYLPAQPGIGRLVLEARPQVAPVFVAGLSSNFAHEIGSMWADDKPIRLHFGAVLDYTAAPPDGATPRAIADDIMRRVRLLGEADRSLAL